MSATVRSRHRALCLAGLLLAAGSAFGGTTCAPTARAGVERCVAGLPPAVLRAMQEAQAASNWCWAASISMVLRRYGLSVPQQAVAKAGLGEAANERIAPEAITGLLNRSWRDEDGRAVQVLASELPSWWRQQGLAAPDVLDDLHHDRPLVLAVQDHAMVLVQVVYERSAGRAVRLLRAMVLDPAAQGGLRALRETERAPDYLARVQARPDSDQVAAAR